MLFEPEELASGVATLRGRRAKHIAEVHRVVAGDALVVGELNGRIGTGTVRAVSSDEVVLEAHFNREPPPPLGIDLLLALPRPKILRRVLAAATSMGVKRIVLVNGQRVERSYFQSPLLERDAIREALVLGLEQGCDTVLPEVLLKRGFKPFVEDQLATLWPEGAHKLLPHPTATQVIRDCDFGTPREPAVIALGPEGGWIPYEVEKLQAAGFQAFSLGPRILRVDTAVPAVLAQVALLRDVRVGT